MTTTNTVERISVLEMFTNVTASRKWGTIDDLYNAVADNSDLVSALLQGDVSQRVIKQEIRRLIRQIKNDDGMPLYASIARINADGNAEHVYKQDTLFELSDYEQVIGYHGSRVVHHAQMANYYNRKCKAEHGKQMQLPFDSTSILLD